MIKNFYDFQGKIFLGVDEKEKYIITTPNGQASEDGYTHGQLKNPYIAINRFTSEVQEYLRQKVKKSLEQKGDNAVLGCKYDGDCKICLRRGFYYTKNCPLQSPAKMLKEMCEEGLCE